MKRNQKNNINCHQSPLSPPNKTKVPKKNKITKRRSFVLEIQKKNGKRKKRKSSLKLHTNKTHTQHPI